MQLEVSRQIIAASTVLAQYCGGEEEAEPEAKHLCLLETTSHSNPHFTCLCALGSKRIAIQAVKMFPWQVRNIELVELLVPELFSLEAFWAKST